VTTNVSPRVLFIVKRKEDYNAVTDSNIGLSTGLYNSCNFVVEMLVAAGVEAKMVVVVDNNDIDREVTAYRPTHAIIEALWVVPPKFTILNKLHPTVQWIIRLHSEVPFIAAEGMAMEWIGEYSAFPSITIAANSDRMLREIRAYLTIRNGWDEETAEQKVIDLPNFYPATHVWKTIDKSKDTIDIGCFGAIRPLKNQLMQALAAVEFADQIGKKLRFHTNSGRIEGVGGPVLRNLRGLFEQLQPVGHEMIEHTWCPHDQFLQLCAQMDIGMQVSFSETFNIVGADLTNVGVPLVTSEELPWIHTFAVADCTDSEEIVGRLQLAYDWPRLNNWVNYRGLRGYAQRTRAAWLRYLRG
jgi:hypothetical protein